MSVAALLRSCARPLFVLERLSVIRDADRRITRMRYVMPQHKAANWDGPGRGRKSTRPGGTGVVELSPFELFDRLADLVPPPRKHRHRYHGVFAPDHTPRKAVTPLAIGNVAVSAHQAARSALACDWASVTTSGAVRRRGAEFGDSVFCMANVYLCSFQDAACNDRGSRWRARRSQPSRPKVAHRNHAQQEPDDDDRRPARRRRFRPV